MDAERAGADDALATHLRRIRLVARVAAAIWILAAALLTLRISDRVLSGYMSDAEDHAGRDATAITSVVDRMFHELATIAKVLSSSQQLRAIVTRYNADGESLARMTPDARGKRLAGDAEVSRADQRLTSIRNDLNYDLLYVLNRQGIRIVSSDWDQPLALLGVQLDDRAYFKEAMAGHPGQMFAVARTTKNPVLFFSAPIETDEGPIGAVVVRQDSDAMGDALSGGRHVTFIVDAKGMVVASSRKDLTLYHVGPLGEQPPDAATLRSLYAQDALRTIDVRRPARALRGDEWMFDGHLYLLNRSRLLDPNYSLLVLSPVDRLEAVRPLHYAIGGLAALFGILIALLGARRAEGLARRRHSLLVTAAFNEKLKALNTEKDRYLGIAAHDLRNPLSSMRGLAELMLDAPLEAGQQKEFLETIRRTSDEMLGLVNDLLDTSVIESGNLDLRRADQDVSKLVRQRIRHLEPAARVKQIAIQLDAAPGLRANIDAARFAQVVDNLVSNAIKFSPPGTAVRVGLQSDAAGFTFSVQDQGPGIPAHDRALMFRSFQKLSARPTGGEKSTGLGLAIVKKIIDAHGGQIGVDDAPGGGARFTVTMPSASSSGSQADGRQAEYSRAAG